MFTVIFFAKSTLHRVFWRCSLASGCMHVDQPSMLRLYPWFLHVTSISVVESDIVIICRTKIPEEDLEKILESIQLHFHQKTSNEDSVTANAEQAPSSSTNERLVPSAAGSVSTMSAVFDDRKLKNLRKKLEQIEGLKERQEKGEKLEANQASSLLDKVKPLNSEIQMT